MGRMSFKVGRKKYVADRSFGTRRVFVYRGATHARLLSKCKCTDDAEYHLADSTGVIISDTLVIDQPDGTDKQLEWTLDAYLKVSRVKYQ